MASNEAKPSHSEKFEHTFTDFLRGYHEYMDKWVPVTQETLIVKHEPDNTHDRHAMAAYKPDSCEVLGHVPRSYSRVFHYFVKRGGTVKAVVKGKRMNRGLGNGLEIPVQYIFHGEKKDTVALKQLLCKSKSKWTCESHVISGNFTASDKHFLGNCSLVTGGVR